MTGDGRPKKTSTAQRQFPVSEAEARTSLTHQQVSKWRRRLKEPEKYRAMLHGAAYAKAMAEASNTTAIKGGSLRCATASSQGRAWVKRRHMTAV